MEYRRKISVHTLVPQLGDPGLIFVNTGFTKDQKVPIVFDDGLACDDNGKQHSDFKQLGAECGGHGKSWAEVTRHRMWCDLPWATDRGSVQGCIASSVICLREFVVSDLAMVSHGVCARASCDENEMTLVRTVRLVEGAAGASAWSAGDMPAMVRRPGVHQKMCRLLAWMKSQVHSCHHTTDLASQKSISEA
jgi:hypothetical protein